MEMTPDEAISQFLAGLSQDQIKKLKLEVVKLLEQYPGKQQKGLRNAWRRLGSEWWDSKNYDLRECLENVLAK